MDNVFFPWHLVLVIPLLVLVLWPWTKILRRMGFSPWLCLLFFVPLVNFVLLYYIAYAQWPRDKSGATGA
jgi:hypothetical protein